jgi:hypothetical protein
MPKFIPKVAPPSRDYFRRLIHEWVVFVTDLSPNLIIPAGQKIPPKMPSNTEWVSFMVKEVRPYGASKQYNDEELMMFRLNDLIVSFTVYGDGADSLAWLIRDGVEHDYPMESMNDKRMMPIDSTPILSMPEMINEEWINRCDFTVRFRYWEIMEYELPSVLELDLTLIDLNLEGSK